MLSFATYCNFEERALQLLTNIGVLSSPHRSSTCCIVLYAVSQKKQDTSLVGNFAKCQALTDFKNYVTSKLNDKFAAK